MALFNNPVIADLLAKYRPIAAMTYSSSLLGWDLEINMPEAGAAARGKAQAELELLRQKMTLDLADLVEKGWVETSKRNLFIGIPRTDRSFWLSCFIAGTS